MNAAEEILAIISNAVKKHGGEILRRIQTTLRAFDANEAMSIVFARVNSLKQEIAQQLLDILFTA